MNLAHSPQRSFLTPSIGILSKDEDQFPLFKLPQKIVQRYQRHALPVPVFMQYLYWPCFVSLPQPGNYELEYNTREYLKELLRIDLMNKLCKAKNLNEFVETIFPSSCLPLPLDTLISKMMSDSEEINKENETSEVKGGESDHKSKRRRRRGPDNQGKRRKPLQQRIGLARLLTALLANGAPQCR